MRDKQFVAVHRGGILTPENHRLLASWAADCAERALTVFSNAKPDDERPAKAIAVARAWSRGEMTVGAARAASVAAHAAAREADDPAACYAARAAGHAVATAHMADHAPGAALYAIKAFKAVQAPQVSYSVIVTEQDWQVQHLPAGIRELVLTALEQNKSLIK